MDNKNADGKFGDLIKRIHVLLDTWEALDKNLNPGKKSIKNSHEKFIPWYIGRSIFTLVGNIYFLAQEDEFLASSILARSVLEGQANIAKIYHSNNPGRLTKTMLDQSENLRKHLLNTSTKLKDMKGLGAGPIVDRLRPRGEAYIIIYSQLSGYCHMDTSAFLHDGLGKQKEATNLTLQFTIMSATDSLKMLKNLLPIKENTKEEVHKQIDNLVKKEEEILQNKLQKYEKIKSTSHELTTG